MVQVLAHLRLDEANPSKLVQPDRLAAEHRRVVQAYASWLIARDVRPQHADSPEVDVLTLLPERWRRCAWLQARELVQSWRFGKLAVGAGAARHTAERFGADQADAWVVG